MRIEKSIDGGGTGSGSRIFREIAGPLEMKSELSGSSMWPDKKKPPDFSMHF